VFRGNDLVLKGISKTEELAAPNVVDEEMVVQDEAQSTSVDDVEREEEMDAVENPSWTMVLRSENRIQVRDVYIFHHYDRDVAPTMM
jgi:hypothetical protein